MDPLTNEDMERTPANYQLPHSEFFPSYPTFADSSREKINAVHAALKSRGLYVQDSRSGGWRLENVRVMDLYHNKIENPTSEEQWATLFNQVSKDCITNCR